MLPRNSKFLNQPVTFESNRDVRIESSQVPRENSEGLTLLGHHVVTAMLSLQCRQVWLVDVSTRLFDSWTVCSCVVEVMWTIEGCELVQAACFRL